MEYAENQMEALQEWLERKRQEHQIEEQEKTMQFEIKLQETKLKLQEEHDLKMSTQKHSKRTASQPSQASETSNH